MIAVYEIVHARKFGRLQYMKSLMPGNVGAAALYEIVYAR